nr:hypothetical protein [Tanacetum cinerariifolium]
MKEILLALASGHGARHDGARKSWAVSLAPAQNARVPLPRMIVYDSDLKALAKIIGEQLGLEIKLSDGLLHIGNMVLPRTVEQVSDLPLDNGIRALQNGCTKLEKLRIHLRSGGLTDMQDLQIPPSLLAYYLVADRRKDFPDSVTPIYSYIDSETDSELALG